MKKNTISSKFIYLLLLNMIIFAIAILTVFILPKTENHPKASPSISRKYPKDSKKGQLESMMEKYPDIGYILDHFDEYPSEIIDFLLNNPDTLDFALQYLKQKDKLDDNLSSIDLLSFPKLYQWDPRWGYTNYGDSMMAFTGCGPTVLSMAAIHLTKDITYTPYYISQFSEQNGFYVPSIGTSWDLFTQGSKALGLNCSPLSLDEQYINQVLENGGLVICSMRPGDFTNTGHFIIIYGKDKNGYYKLHDPNSKERSQKTWSYEKLAYQINNLWEITANKN
ncbi:hypothetical protein M2475_001314 [Breznakia sp. PF5-3]|uniref:C39 family peptidase n=1 Tax=unclassified Breznakia TaxID=2623764 RepID=UPI0024076443|nr:MULTISPECIES: C39 family peptidase [unclassified Breznakia]MDF9824804.1 hypothetical protein [Breznakia sp. PM6-1]MDF9835740.1 hypothetical protein [Breznakia sp. PF5-3]MDF9837826.1 hypothetical protein [Breznakia sp. PFB2-8]MDF9859803.1 hypothetical protein [Breznakia sp. PH5-24]